MYNINQIETVNVQNIIKLQSIDLDHLNDRQILSK